MKRRIIQWSLLCAIWPSVAAAQLQSTASLTTSVDNNAYRNYSATEDVISQLNVDISTGWTLAKWKGQFYYDGYLNHFADNSDRTFQFHRFGFASQRNLGASKGQLSTGARLAIRVDGEAYDVYDYSEVSGYLNLKFPLKGLGIFYTGYNVRMRDYANLQELSNWEHTAFGRLNISLPSRTTFIFSTQLGYKDYISQVVAEVVEQTDGDGMNNPGRGNRTSIMYTEVDNPSAGQWVNSVRISQSLFSKTGLSAYGRKRQNFGDDGRFLTSLETGYFTEDELYDDRYGYESLETGVLLSQLLQSNLMLRLGLDYYDKDYQRGALDLDGNSLPGEVLRADNRHQIWGSLEKTFKIRHLGRSLKLSLEYLYLRNDSNDPYYDYSANVVTLGTELSF